MKRLSCLFTCLFLLILARTTHAQVALGQMVATFPYAPSKVLADPSRSQVYVADTASKSIVVIDTTTLKAIAIIPVAAAGDALYPVDLAISLDTASPDQRGFYGNSLYVANAGVVTAGNGASATATIVAIDLPTLTVRNVFPLQGMTPLALTAGSSNRVYFTAIGSNTTSNAYQMDGTTGLIQATFDVNFAGIAGALQIAPLGNTLFVASGYTSGSSAGLNNLRSYNITGFTPGIEQTFSAASIGGEQLVVSHTGAYLCLPGTGGNFANMGVSTALFSAANINTLYGAFNNGTFPGLVAFSPDDQLVYQTRSSSGTNEDLLDVFSTQNFSRISEVALPGFTASSTASGFVNTIATDNTGSYLFLGANNATTAGTAAVSGRLIVLGTGTGTLAPPVAPAITSALTATATAGTAFSYQITASNIPASFAAVGLPAGLTVDTAGGLISGTPTATGTFSVALNASNLAGQGTATLVLTVADATPPVVVLPTVSLLTTVSTVVAGSNDAATVMVMRSGDLSGKLNVFYSIGGTAQNGVDYLTLLGRVKLKPGKDTAFINIVPAGPSADGTQKNVKLKLLPEATYQFGGATKKAKVSILPGN